ncbi:uncharacterized protein [Coffea arabica]|uniref:Chaperone DnaJ C-terminal domain-containing protein n=1 Tax=Coffea arabica TaxID=13443 RepID=A0A6P6UT02_COFAR|nr:dnaJ protein homolog [Coffea arabica]
MEDHSQAPPPDLHSGRSLEGVCRKCKSFVRRCYPERHPSPLKTTDTNKHRSLEKEHKALDRSNCNQVNMNGMHDCRYNEEGSPRGIPKRGSYEKAYFTRSPLSSPPASRNTSPSPLSRSTSKRSLTPIRSAAANLLRSMSRRKSAEATTLPSTLSRSVSRKASTTIMYSNSNGLMKPPAMEMTLECTLEELCFGCIKKMKITRDSVTDDGQLIQEDEVLTIKVKPGWRKGTKITFEGMGNEMPGADPADVIFTVLEKRHHMYRREGDDLELAVEIPLVKALTGCIFAIPLLGGEKMILTIDDIIYPGYQKIIPGHGMPKPHEQGERGNLIITMLVKFPTELTDEQRSEIVSILRDSC